MARDGLVGFGAGRRRVAAVLDPLPEEAGGEAVEVEGLGAERVEARPAMILGEADHALHGGEGLFGEVARGEAALGPGQGVGPDAAGPFEQDVAVVGFADVAHRLEAVGHVLGPGSVLVAPALAEMDGEALAAAFEEHFDHALAEARVDLAADNAVGHRVVVAFDAHMAVRPDLAVDPLAPLPGVRRQGLERRPLVRLEHGAAALAACHGGVVEPVELAADRGVHRVQREEGLMAQRLCIP